MKFIDQSSKTVHNTVAEIFANIEVIKMRWSEPRIGTKILASSFFFSLMWINFQLIFETELPFLKYFGLILFLFTTIMALLIWQVGIGQNLYHDINKKVKNKLISRDFKFSAEASKISRDSHFFLESFVCNQEQYNILCCHSKLDAKINWIRKTKSKTGNHQDLYSFLNFATNGKLSKWDDDVVDRFFTYISQNMEVNGYPLELIKMNKTFKNWKKSTDFNDDIRLQVMKLEMNR